METEYNWQAMYLDKVPGMVRLHARRLTRRGDAVALLIPGDTMVTVYIGPPDKLASMEHGQVELGPYVDSLIERGYTLIWGQ